MSKVKIEPKYKNMRVMVFNNELGSFTVQRVVQIAGDKIETDDDLLPIEAARKFVDETSGLIYYIFDLDLPAKVESNNLKSLRRSVALKRIFDYDKEQNFDLFRFLPYLIIILMAIFR